MVVYVGVLIVLIILMVLVVYVGVLKIVYAGSLMRLVSITPGHAKLD